MDKVHYPVLEEDIFLSMLKNHPYCWDGFRGISPSCHPSLMVVLDKRKNAYKEARLIKKLFSDVPPFTIVVMEKKEILAEKMRALCMRAEPRDIYDIWALISLGETIDRKLLYKKLREDNIKHFKLNLPSKKSYENDLKLLLKNVPEYENVVECVETSLDGMKI